MTAVLLPVKSVRNAKQRLSDCLSAGERQELVWAMLRDVTQSLLPLRGTAFTVVVSSDAEVLEFARRLGLEVIQEDDSPGESRSVDRASARLRARGFGRVLRVPCDIPLVREADIRTILDAAPGTCVLVPSRSGRGTNALLRTPPDAFLSSFGPGSFQQHVQAAKEAGVPLQIIRNPRIELDLDTPADLRSFLGRATRGETLETLRRMGIERRLEGHRDRDH